MNRDKQDEIMMPVSSPEAMQQALVLVLRQVSDGQALINKSLEKLTSRVDNIHDDVTKLKTLEFDKEITRVELKFESAFEKLVTSSMVYRDKIDAERQQLRADIADIKGKILPLITVGGMVAVVVVTWVMEKVLA